MNEEQLSTILNDIEYKDWKFRIANRDNHLFVRAMFYDDGEQVTRDWYIEPSMSLSEVVRTVFALVLMAEEHEARERFRYRSKRVMGPHFDVNAKVELELPFVAKKF